MIIFKSSLDHLLASLAYVDLRIRWAVARARAHGLNPDDDFRGLYISEEEVDALLGYELGESLWAGPNGTSADLTAWPAAVEQARQAWVTRTEQSRAANDRLALDVLMREFGLDACEIDALLLALAPEIDPRYERLYAYLQDDVTKKRPSVNLILDLLTDSFTEKLRLRRLFADDSHLIQNRLLMRFGDGNAREPTLLSQFVRPATAVVEYLLGHRALDEQLLDSARFLSAGETYPPSHVPLEALENLLESATANPMLSFVGGYGTGKRATALYVAQTLERPLLELDLVALTNSEAGLREGLRLATRDGRLSQAILYLTGWDHLMRENQPPPYLSHVLFAYPHVVIVSGEERWYPIRRPHDRPFVSIAFDVPDYDGRLRVWHHYLGDEEVDTTTVANHFRFSPGQIKDVAATARDMARWERAPLNEDHLAAASRAHSNQKLATLATKIKPRYQWRDIVLPDDTLAQLKEMVNTVHQRPTVYNQWGFGRKLAMGKGLNALFAGEPGTGKTMSADIIAGELGLDLYKIDLSTVVDKYIGETEKNIGRIFDEATTSNAILFFDEADSLFGKRSEVKDSHDRHANIQTGYLLQRMEEFDGVVILATNLRANIDEAFTRRLHFAIEFPFPEPADRERIWQVTFPRETPLAADVDFQLLAERFRIAGGNIRNIVLAAAFLAAESDQPVGMVHILHAARREYQKMGRLIHEHLFARPAESS